jgi:ComF family protein
LGCTSALLIQEEILCIACATRIAKTHHYHIKDNETALRFIGRIPFEYACSFAYFTKNSLVQTLMHELKYKGNQKVGQYLGKQFGLALQKSDWIQSIDILIPIPLFSKKESERGFNQSACIGAAMADYLVKPMRIDVLQRIRHTDSQTQKSRQERVMNMQDAFGVTNSSGLAGKHVLLIDDVLTTGATIESCVMALQKIQGIRISIASIGIAVD